MSYRKFMLLISCLAHFHLHTFAIPSDNYLHLLSIYSKFRSINDWTHFICYQKDELARLALKSSSNDVKSKFHTNFANAIDFVDSKEINRQGFVIDMSCEGFVSIFNQQQHPLLFNSNNLWLFLEYVDELHLKLVANLTHTSEIMNELDMLPNSDVVLAQFDTQENKWTLYDIYKVARNHTLEMSVLGWLNGHTTDNNSLRLNEGSHKMIARKNLKGLSLRCGSLVKETVPLTYLDDGNLDQTDIAAYSTMEVSWLLQDDLNFSCDIVEVSNYERHQNTLANLYHEHQIETLAHAENMRAEQLQFAEFTADIFAISTPIIFRQPPLSAVSNIFLLPLDKMVWYCYAALILCVIFIMGIQMGHPLLEAQITLFDVVSFVFGAACQQGTHLFIPSLSGRFVLITTFVATLALFTSYSASIVALLQSPSESIHTLDDLLASRLTLAVKDSNTTRRFFSSESKTVLRRLYNEKIQPMGTNAWITDEYIGIERVRSELFAFLIEAPLAYNAISHTYTELEKCRLSEIRVFASPMNTITVARNSGYKQLIKQRLLWMREVGLIYRTRVKWLPKKPACEGDGRDFTIVGLREIYPLIYVYLFGSIISMLIFCVEICSIRCGPLLKQSKQYARKQTILLNN